MAKQLGQAGVRLGRPRRQRRHLVQAHVLDRRRLAPVRPDELCPQLAGAVRYLH